MFQIAAIRHEKIERERERKPAACSHYSISVKTACHRKLLLILVIHELVHSFVPAQRSSGAERNSRPTSCSEFEAAVEYASSGPQPKESINELLERESDFNKPTDS